MLKILNYRDGHKVAISIADYAASIQYDESFKELTFDIKKNGQLQASLATADGIIICGARRVAACHMLEIEPKVAYHEQTYEELGQAKFTAMQMSENDIREDVALSKKALAVSEMGHKLALAAGISKKEFKLYSKLAGLVNANMESFVRLFDNGLLELRSFENEIVSIENIRLCYLELVKIDKFTNAPQLWAKIDRLVNVSLAESGEQMNVHEIYDRIMENYPEGGIMLLGSNNSAKLVELFMKNPYIEVVKPGKYAILSESEKTAYQLSNNDVSIVPYTDDMSIFEVVVKPKETAFLKEVMANYKHDLNVHFANAFIDLQKLGINVSLDSLILTTQKGGKIYLRENVAEVLGIQDRFIAYDSQGKIPFMIHNLFKNKKYVLKVGENGLSSEFLERAGALEDAETFINLVDGYDSQFFTNDDKTILKEIWIQYKQ